MIDTTMNKESKFLIEGAEKYHKESFVFSKSKYTDNIIVSTMSLSSTLGQIHLWTNKNGQVCGVDFMMEKDT